MMRPTATQKGFTLIELMIVIAIIGILAAVAIPQYQNYITRSQVNRVMSESGQLRTAVEDCILNGRLDIGTGVGECDPGATGSNLIDDGQGSQTGATLPPDTGVPQITDPLVGDGSDTITATFGSNAAAVLQNNNATLTWTRAADGTWTCDTHGVDPEFVPNGCQGAGGGN